MWARCCARGEDRNFQGGTDGWDKLGARSGGERGVAACRFVGLLVYGVEYLDAERL